ncbi:MAG: hypothetical protein PHT60_14950 [Acidiphilium sp.]|nr:hypothetical protein [Acidiphilium sp.]MDD4937060.1 hypothetical protein [Acidiphilium sp.]
MQGFVNFATDIANVLSLLIPFICYIVGVSCFLLAGYGAWQMMKPGTIWSGKKYLPPLLMLFGSVLLSFNEFLNFSNNSFGGGTQTNIQNGFMPFRAPNIGTAGFVGATPEQTFFNLVKIFAKFFIAYGAFNVLLAWLGTKGVAEGKRRHGYSLPGIQFVFGIALMNIVAISTTMMGYFT